MARIQIHIKKTGEETLLRKTLSGSKLVGLFLIIISSLFLGAFAQGRFSILNLPKPNPETQLSAVAEALQASNVSRRDESKLVADAVLLASNTGVIETVADVGASSPTSDSQPSPTDSRINELDIFMNDHENALNELNMEIALIKDRSVTFIGEFNQNCGNWKDNCATPYAKELETNNARYSQLISKLSLFKQEIANAKSEQATLAQ